MKSNYKIIGYLSFSIIIFLTSCTKTLDVEPKSVITNSSFWKSENDATGVLNGMYSYLRDMNKMTYQLGEGRSEVMTYGIAGTGGYDLFYNNTLNPNNLAASGNYTSGVDWKGYYTTVNAANLLIKYVPPIQFASEDDKNRILAQAYATRAFVYFVMVRTWGELPIRTEPTEGYDANTTFVERSPVEKVFELIKSDIDQAVQLFPDYAIPSGRYMWSKPSVNALKADVYLWTGKRLNGGDADFTTALNACEEVEKGDVALLPKFSDIYSYGNKGNKETLMVLRFQLLEQTAVFSYFRDMYMFGGLMPSGVTQYTRDFIGVNTGGGHSVWSPSALIRNQFTKDDSRRDGSFYEIYDYQSPDDSIYFTAAVLKGTGAINSGGLREYVSDIIIYRYAEVLLMKAEAKNALGQDPSVEMNLIRQRAYGDHYNDHIFSNAGKAQNDEAILKERLLELVFEGKRWWDLLRFEKAFEIVPSLQGREGESYLLLFPISTNTLSLEPLVKQNPGYE